MVDYVARYAWTTEDRESGNKVHRYKTVRRSDGVVVGEHLEMEYPWPSIARGKRWLWGTCDTDSESREMFQMWGCSECLHQPDHEKSRSA